MKKKCPEGVHDIEDCFSEPHQIRGTESGPMRTYPGIPDPSMVQFDSGATRSAEPMEDPEGFFSPFVMDEYIKYMAKNRKQADGQIRSSDNWQNGMSKARYMRALFRHFLEAWRVWRRPKVYEDELIAGLCGVIFNAQGMILELLIKRGDIERPAIRSEEG